MKKYIISFISILLLAGCGSKAENKETGIVSMQTIDRNGFSETISSKERLANFSKVDFLAPQPYKKVLRVYPRSDQGQSVSRITSYHSNGQIWQYLEVAEGRAHGVYQEWHPNGKMKIEAYVIEGLADVGDSAQASWLFEGLSKVWDDQGKLLVEFSYEKGVLHGNTRYFHEDGSLAKIIPYHHNEIHGIVIVCSLTGEELEKIPFANGLKEGVAEGKAANNAWSFWERYSNGKLLEARYTSTTWEKLPQVTNGEGFQISFDKSRIASIAEIHQGKPLGSVRIFNEDESLESLFHIKEEIKHGEELLFFRSSKTTDPLTLPQHAKLSLQWHDDSIHGVAKSWYENGVLESQREMNRNKKHGLSLAYFADGSLMLMEEYEQDRLVKGTYYKHGDKLPVSKVEDGTGTTTLFDGEGRFKQKIHYDRGWPKIGND